jgi:hypothetical protein
LAVRSGARHVGHAVPGGGDQQLITIRKAGGAQPESIIAVL